MTERTGIRRGTFARWACAPLAAAVVGGLALLPRADGQVARLAGARKVVRPNSPADTGPMPLVQVDDELVGALHKAQEHIEAGRHDEAVEILQLLIKRPDSGFHVGRDGKHFVSLRLKAHELIGAMGAKGLRLYRTLYDPQAERLYREAMASDRPAGLLRRLADEYLHTTYGPKALGTLGAIHFDEGRFPQAATCWRQLLPLTEDGPATALLLAEIAAAHHLGGEPARAREAMAELSRKYPKTATVLGGTQRGLVEFVRSVEQMPVAMAPQSEDSRPGDCSVVLAPRWQHPDAAQSLGDDVTGGLQAGGRMYFSSATNAAYVRSGFRRTIALRDGHLRLTNVASGRARQEVHLPAMVHPVVLDEEVICRLEDKVRAFDLLTGRMVWESTSLPMVRTVSVPGMPYYYGYGVGYVGDAGRYALTVGGGKVYTVYDFLPSSQMSYYILQRNPNLRDQLSDHSVLAALSLGAEGLLKWRLGAGQGDIDVLKFGKFLCPPAYHAGRLYAISLYLQRYHLSCLDADSGSLIWSVPIAQSPAMIQQYGYYQGSDHMISVGSPPAVADGRVYVATNSGVVAAFEAEGGQPLWAYQYDSRVNRGVSRRMPYNPYQQMVYPPANPLLVVRGRVIALPADAEQIIALDAATGEPVWQVGRRNQNDLSAVDTGRVLLSGPGLFVLDTAGGRELAGGAESRDIYGRPLVTQTAVLACSRGKLLHMDLATYGITSKGLTTPYGILGNLASAQGKLAAANMLGLCAYFSYDVAREELTARLAKAAPADRAKLLLQRGQLAFDDRRFDAALADLLACKEAADAAGSTQVAAQLPAMFYRTYVALGNHAAKRERMHEMFLKAQDCAETKQEKAHILLRLAKYHEKVAEYERAAELAQNLSETFADEELVDVQIGPGADDSVRFGPASRTVRGERLGRDYIQGLIEKYGRGCYAKFDALARAALDKARQAGEPAGVLAVEKRWPNSEWADDALFAAAETYYTRAGVQKDKADDYLAEARRHLYRVARMTDSPLRASASVGLATIYSRGGWVTSARNECNWLRDLSGETAVAFADVKGSLTEVLKAIEGGGSGGFQRLTLLSEIRPPLAALFTLAGDNMYVLRDQDYQPVRIGEKVVVIKGDEAYLLDTGAENAKQAVEGWKGLAGVDARTFQQYPYFPPGMRLLGAVSQDRKTLVVADRTTIRGLDLASAKVVWQQRMDQVGVKQFYCMAVGEGVLVAVDSGGTVSCLDLKDGKVLWQNRLVGQVRYANAPPWIGGDLVVVQHNNMRTVTAFSLAKGGRVVGKWEAKQFSQCDLTADGLLVLLIDGELTVREVGQINKPLWTHRYDGSRFPAVLACSTESVVVSPDQTGGPLEVLSIPGSGRKVATLKLADVNGMQAVPVDAQFDGQALYVICSAQMIGRRKAYYGRMSSCRGVAVQKFEVPTEKRLWSRMLEDASQYYPNVLPLTVGKDHVVVTARQYNVGMDHFVYVLEAGTGKEVQKINLQVKAGGDAQAQQRRRQGMGQPAMTTGRLVVETSEGVTVYGEK